MEEKWQVCESKDSDLGHSSQFIPGIFSNYGGLYFEIVFVTSFGKLVFLITILKSFNISETLLF